eukprot:gene8674-11719_t
MQRDDSGHCYCSMLVNPDPYFSMESLLHKKRGRDSNFFVDEAEYIKNKRILQESLEQLRITPDTPPNTPCTQNNRIINNNFNINLESNIVNDDSAIYEGNQVESNEEFISVLKGGRRKYLRKVDYLVDELIRKSHRNQNFNSSTNDESQTWIPNSIGPQPGTDNNLISNKNWPIQFFENAIKLLKNNKTIDDPTFSNSKMIVSNPSNAEMCTDLVASSGFPISLPTNCRILFDETSGVGLIEEYNTQPRHSGYVTHNDWGIEEIQQPVSYSSANIYPNNSFSYDNSNNSYYENINNYNTNPIMNTVNVDNSAPMEMDQTNYIATSTPLVNNSHINQSIFTSYNSQKQSSVSVSTASSFSPDSMGSDTTMNEDDYEIIVNG